jgi:hypothetical protein
MFGNRLVNTNAGGGGCTNTVDNYDPFPDGGGLALYQLNGDATDVSGNYDGAWSGTAAYTTGVFGQAGVFNNVGANDSNSIDTNTKSFFGQKQTCSVSAWIKNSSTFASTYGTIFTDYANTSFNILIWMNSNGTIQLYNRYNNANTTITSSSTYNDNQWHHIVGVINTSNNTMQFYIDNVEIGNVSISANAYSSSYTGTMKVTIGNLYAVHQSNYNSGFIGSIDQIRIFNRALRPYEVEALYTEEYCTPTIVPSEHFNTITWTGDGALTRSFTGVGFQPDFVWTKIRSLADSHHLFDSVRGLPLELRSNTTNAELTSSYGNITSFDIDGFTTTSGANGNSNQNALNETIVAWNFKAGGAAVTNTDGTITSQVSANTEAGFSIVSYTAPSSVIGYTVGHGLNTAPSLIIVKDRDNAIGYPVFSSSLATAQQKFLLLNTNAAAATSTNMWNNTLPTNSVFSQKAGYSTNTNAKAIAYCFAEVEGFSSFGSYVGNGSASGPIINCGFEPAFVMIKGANVSPTNWNIHDNKRDTDSFNDKFLFANLSNQEVDDAAGRVIFLSNGFQIGTSDFSRNESGYTYIYMAFAADPTTVEPSLEDSFNTVTYTGTGASRSITGVGFQPDFTWIKGRSDAADYHNLFDSVRGADKVLISNLTNAEFDGGGSAYFPSFDSDGFSLSGNSIVNGSGQTYVSWNWKGAELPAINSNGSIPSVVSANPAAGFSIVSYVGNGQYAQTVGHGLGKTPSIVFTKNRQGTTSLSYHWAFAYIPDSISAYLNLDLAFDAGRFDVMFGPGVNSNVFEVTRGISNYGHTNGFNNDIIAYCFAEVEGFSSFGSYVGNNVLTTVVTGFEPAFVMVKNADATGNWVIIDNKRSDNELYANTNGAEAYEASIPTLLENGFVLNGARYNNNGNKFIYMAFANQF